jgi:hypothetical protein
LRAAYYLGHERGWDLLQVFGRNWYWTDDWYAELPSYGTGRTARWCPFNTTAYPYKALKSVHITVFERDGVLPEMRAANHGLLYVREPAAGGQTGARAFMDDE